MSGAVQEKNKTVKIALKEAREFIETKDYKSALRVKKHPKNKTYIPG